MKARQEGAPHFSDSGLFSVFSVPSVVNLLLPFFLLLPHRS